MHILSVPAIYALELTAVCNNRCPGCSNVYAEQRRGPPPLSAQQWRELLAPFVAEAVQIRLTGGEPTLHPQFFEILDEVTSHQARVTVFTNGRWAHREQFVERLQSTRHLSGLLVSLHGPTAMSHEAFSGVSGSFEETLANIRLAIHAGITVALSTVITRHSWDQLDAMVALGRELGARHVAVNRYIGGPLAAIEPTMVETQYALRRVQALIQQGEAVKYGVGVPQCFAPNDSEGCLAGVAYVSIDPWGNVRPCAHSPTVLGSLLKHSMRALWHSPEMEAWRAMMPADCIACAAYTVCHGGCRAVQELRAGRRDPLHVAPLDHFGRLAQALDLPGLGRPRAEVRLRPESFGYALIGRGRVLPVVEEARPIVEACTGEATFAELAERFGPAGLNLLGELWSEGMLEIL
jgi:radical SAM protein with 4Fe4S-binding SPASM domain